MRFPAIATALAALLSCLPVGEANYKPGCTPEVRKQFANEWPANLDYGIYWMGPNDQYEKATGEKSRFYDPARPTAVFMHGWQGADGGTTKDCTRMGSTCEAVKGHVENMDAWFQKGWNMGIFMWDQFADEECIRDAEYKIWVPGYQRWKKNDCNGPNYVGKMDYDVYKASKSSIGDLCADSVHAAMKDYSGSEVRFLGHSLGSQLAVKCAVQLHGRKSVAAPKRIVLLEPAFSHVGFIGYLQCGSPVITKIGIGAPPEVSNSSDFGELARRETNLGIKNLMDLGVVAEQYTSTKGFLQFTTCNHPILYHSMHVVYRPMFCPNDIGAIFDFSQQGAAGCAHDSVVCLYLRSMGNTPNASSKQRDLSSPSQWALCHSPSAASTVDEIKQISEICKGEGVPHFHQMQGTRTFTTQDDGFNLEFHNNPKPFSWLNSWLHFRHDQRLYSVHDLAKLADPRSGSPLISLLAMTGVAITVTAMVWSVRRALRHSTSGQETEQRERRSGSLMSLVSEESAEETGVE